MNEHIAFVILNYKTPCETLDLLKNIEKQDWSREIGVYVVDNGSNDDSVKLLKKHKTNMKIKILENHINEGFAKGHNLGIKEAVQDGFKFVVASNSDIAIDNQPYFLDVIKDIYCNDRDIGAIAPSIKNLDGVSQNPFRRDSFPSKEILKMKLFYLTYFYKIYYFIRVYILFNYVTSLALKKRKKNITSGVNNNIKSSYIYAPHGSFVIFTPSYFDVYYGFDENTFLFCEEFILAERLVRKGLKCWYENDLKILHKESGAIDEITKNYKEKVKFTLKHTFESCRYFVKFIVGNNNV